ncbi:MAG TPA: hypothetical protein VL985_07810 [Stellaceae bacterium]|nr:hypothetical protein [Stellaceae bacterium]
MVETTSFRDREERTVIAATAPESPMPAVSWAAIIAGAFAMAAISLILLALGAGLGFAAVSPWSNSNPAATTFGIAAGIWLIVVQWLSAAFGGYVTGRLRTKWVAVPSHEIYFRDTAHGFLAWALAAVVTVAALASATTTLVGGIGRVAATATASSAQGAAGSPASGAAATALDPTAYLINQLFRSDHPDVNANFQTSRAEATPIVTRALGEGNMPTADKTYLAALVTARTGLSQPDAAKRVDEVDAQVRTIWVRAHQAADRARKAASDLLLFTAFSMLIGAFIAAVAATVAGHRRDQVLALRHPV